MTELIERGSLAALGVLRADAPRDDPAAGAADPPHGGPRASRRSASCAPAPTGTRSASEYFGGRAAVARRSASRTRRSGATRIHRRPATVGSRMLAASPPVALLPGLLTPHRRRRQGADAAADPAARATSTATSTRCTPAAAGARRYYDIGVAAAPDCGGANACFAASFRGEKGGTPFGARKVDARQRPPRPLPAAELRRVVLTAVDLLEGARRDLHDPGQGRRQADATGDCW